MNVLRRLSSRALIAVVAAGLLVAAIAAAVAVAALTGATPSASEPLDQAIASALAGAPVTGITADVSFENHLFDASGLAGIPGAALLSGASGRLWIDGDGRVRLQLQSSQEEMDVAYDGSTLTLYDPGADTAYELALPAPPAKASGPSLPPSLSQIDALLADLGRYAELSGPTPGTLAGEPAYTVTATPIASGGLAPSATLSFDASTGVPLQFTLEAAGSSTPALALTVTSIAYGPVSASEVELALPSGVKVVPLSFSELAALAALSAPASGLAAVAAAVPFTLVAPETLAGLARGQVRAIGSGAAAAALVSYGSGSERLLVLELAAGALGGVPGQLLELLPGASVGGISVRELVTREGIVLGFSRGGVSYTLVGSLDQADTESAALALGS